MNLKIPLPRTPAWVTRALDRYSDWAEVPVGPNLRIGSWRYRVLRMDYVSLAITLTVCGICAIVWGDYWLAGIAVGAGTSIAAWTIIEWK